MTMAGKTIGGSVDLLVRWVVIPVTSVIPMLVQRGILLAGFAVLWAGFGLALVLEPRALDSAWQAVASAPLPVQAVAWLLFLPVLAGLWVWQTDWPIVVRLAVVAAIAAWNLLVLRPAHDEPAPAATLEEG